MKHRSPTLIFAGLIVASLLAGWFIPHFYAWTDSDQSRPSPLLWQVPVSLAIGSVIFCASLPWLPISLPSASAEPRVATRFSLRALLLITAGIAIMLAVLPRFPLVGGGIITVGMIAGFIGFCWRQRQHRLPAAALAACMILPYAWLAGYPDIGRLLPMVAVSLGAFPTFLPAGLIGSLIGIRFEESPWLAFLLTGVEFAVGLWLIMLGPRRTIAYLLLVLLCSGLGSLVFYQLVRA